MKRALPLPSLHVCICNYALLLSGFISCYFLSVLKCSYCQFGSVRLHCPTSPGSKFQPWLRRSQAPFMLCPTAVLHDDNGLQISYFQRMTGVRPRHKLAISPSGRAIATQTLSICSPHVSVVLLCIHLDFFCSCAPSKYVNTCG